VREILRRKGTPYDELGLDDPKWTDDELIDFMVEHPILMNRPIVVTDSGAALCRPKEKVKSAERCSASYQGGERREKEQTTV
jgi:arsenate reductase